MVARALLVFALILPTPAPPTTYTLEVDGVTFRSEIPIPADFGPRLHRILHVSASYWSVPLDTWAGVNILYTPRDFPCGPYQSAAGCTRGREIQVKAVTGGTTCWESAFFPHELGHVALPGSTLHEDPRFRSLHALWWLMVKSPDAPQVCQDDYRNIEREHVWDSEVGP